LLSSYDTNWPPQWDDHDPQNVVPFVDDLAKRMDTNGQASSIPHGGTYPEDLAAGIEDYLQSEWLQNDYTVITQSVPDPGWVFDEVLHSEDVILLLGFWQEVAPGDWHRVGGHYVTVVGVSPEQGLVAFSDPYLDNAEVGGPGEVWPIGHPPHPFTPTVHNDAAYVSHDIYPITMTNSPGGIWGPEGYADALGPQVQELLGVNPNRQFDFWPYDPVFPVVAEVEYAIVVSPVPPDVTVEKHLALEGGPVVSKDAQPRQAQDVFLDEPVEFTIRLSSSGDIAYSTTLTDIMEPGLSFLSAHPPPTTHTKQVAVWNLDGLRPGDHFINVVAWVGPDVQVSSTLTNTAIVTASNDISDANNTAVAEVHVISDTMFWKAGGWQDYAPSGVPDFDQKQDPMWTEPISGNWSWCGPVAVANSLWWFDSKFEPNPMTYTIPNDGYPLVEAYGSWDDHDPQNVPPFIEDLAARFGTDTGGILGTDIISMTEAVKAYLAERGLLDDYTVELRPYPEPEWLGREILRSEDVILLLSFYQCTQGDPFWCEEFEWLGGHYVTAAGWDFGGGGQPSDGGESWQEKSQSRLGVDAGLPGSMRLGISDPYRDNAERPWAGEVLPSYPHPPTHPLLHNDVAFVSHDTYVVGWGSVPWNPYGGQVLKYSPTVTEVNAHAGMNMPPMLMAPPGVYSDVLPVIVAIEYALAISPAPRITVTKDGPPEVEPGQLLSYTITFTNTGEGTLLDAYVEDTLPQSTTFLYSDPPPSEPPGRTASWKVGTITPGYTSQISLTVQVDFSVQPSTTLTNTVAVYTRDWETGQATYWATGTMTTHVVTPTLPGVSVQKVKTGGPRPHYGPQSGMGGRRLSGWLYDFRILYGNSGQKLANNVFITDTLPMGTQRFSSQSVPDLEPPSGSDPTWQWNAGTLLPASGGYIDLTVLVPFTTTGGGTLTNTVVITTSTPGDPPADNVSAASFKVPLLPPVIAWPIDGTDCDNTLVISGTSHVGYTITVYISGLALTPTVALSDHTWQVTTTLPDGSYVITATASTPFGTSAPSPAVEVTIDSTLLWDPKGTLFIYEDPYSGYRYTQHIKTPAGRADPNGWSVQLLPNATYAVEVPTCCGLAASTQVTLWVDSTAYPLSDPDGDGVFTGSFVAPASQASLIIEITCDGQHQEGHGGALIDPDGFIFDVDVGKGGGELAGMMVTCWDYNPALPGWEIWPAALYNSQVNPQVTGADGYYSYYTPKGDYRITVSETADYQPYKSWTLTVISDPVHLDIPLTRKYTTTHYTITVNDAGFAPAFITVEVDSVIAWQNVETDTTRLHTTTSIDPDARDVTDPRRALGWDSGLLNAGQVYRRGFSDYGIFTYGDHEVGGNTGQVYVRYWADLTGDGSVMVDDIIFAASRWNDPANYEPIADIDGDGDIDIVDIQKVAGEWGWLP
ncbi:MAG TPA: DUF11 domain-containing protein, partial [Anaerolineae bacterium]|nr:DUF11 domain-containing protein [Anaerolineae bacterium]